MFVNLDLADEIAALGLETVAPHRFEADVPLRVCGDGERRDVDVGDEDVRGLAGLEPETPDGAACS